MSSEPNLRNRVAGAVVLVSLAVIFLPLILDGKKKTQILESYIPDKPKSGEIILVNIDDKNANDEQSMATISPSNPATSQDNTSLTIAAEEIVAKKAEDSVSDTPAEVTETGSNESAVAEVIKEPAPQPQRTNRPNYQQGAHLVQIGSFSSQENASRLVTTLVNSKHRAYYKSGLSNGKRIYRVFAGPYLSKSDAESAMRAMQKLVDVKPIIVTYDPIKHAQS